MQSVTAKPTSVASSTSTSYYGSPYPSRGRFHRSAPFKGSQLKLVRIAPHRAELGFEASAELLSKFMSNGKLISFLCDDASSGGCQLRITVDEKALELKISKRLSPRSIMSEAYADLVACISRFVWAEPPFGDLARELFGKNGNIETGAVSS